MFRSIILSALLSVAASQVTYTNCHNVTASTALVEWCYGSNGSETPLVTFAASVPSTLTTSTVPASVAASTTSSGQTTAVTACHKHDTAVYCINGAGKEVSVSYTATPTGEPPAQYTGCHAHGTQQYCMAPNGDEVRIVSDSTSSTNSTSSGSSSGEMDCHFHAGVEHCVPIGGSESGSATVSCVRRDRDYNIPVRVGTLFAVLVTSGLGVFLPILVDKFSSGRVGINSLIFSFFKQFGTGVIIATALVHLYTHATLMFTNDCLGRLSYEATTSAIVMAGAFIAFLIEFLSRRLMSSRLSRASTPSTDIQENITKTPDGRIPHSSPDLATPRTNSKLSVLVLEAGIIFHSLILGLTLVVAGDSAYITLFIVIVFHQMFEGLALGSRIASLPSSTASLWPTKALMGLAFAFVTPLGMGIGIGVLRRFNGNDPSTIVAIGTLDAFSAGILLWVGLVQMWAADWVMPGGEMFEGRAGTVALGGFGLICGLVLMSVLGKWA